MRWQESRYTPITHLGTFKTRTEAELRRGWALREVASGRAPDPRAALSRARRRPSLNEVAAAWMATRIDLAEATRERYEDRAQHFLADFGEHEAEALTAAQIQAWIIEQQAEYAARTLRGTVMVLRQILDHAGVEPNPAAGKLRLPRIEHERMQLPPRAHIAAMLAFSHERTHALLRLLEHTGLRIQSACDLQWGDYDAERDRVWVSDKTPSGRRWVQLGGVPERLGVRTRFVETLGEIPQRPVGSSEARRVFGMTPSAIQAAMRRACIKAGIPHYHPHDFRHLHASRLLADGWPPAEVAARLGHSHPGTTLRIYAHTVPPD